MRNKNVLVTFYGIEETNNMLLLKRENRRHKHEEFLNVVNKELFESLTKSKELPDEECKEAVAKQLKERLSSVAIVSMDQDDFIAKYAQEGLVFFASDNFEDLKELTESFFGRDEKVDRVKELKQILEPRNAVAMNPRNRSMK